MVAAGYEIFPPAPDPDDALQAERERLERPQPPQLEERAAVYGSTPDDPAKHFIGWLDDVDPDELREFVASLEDGSERRVLTTALRARGGYQHFREAVDALPVAREEWQQFSHASLKERIVQWLAEVSVEPL